MPLDESYFSPLVYGFSLAFLEGKRIHVYGSEDVMTSLSNHGFQNCDASDADVLICTEAKLTTGRILDEMRNYLVSNARYFYIFIQPNYLYAKSTEAYSFRSFLIKNNNNILDTIIDLPANKKSNNFYSLIILDKDRNNNGIKNVNFIKYYGYDIYEIFYLYKNNEYFGLEEIMLYFFGDKIKNIDGFFCTIDFRELNDEKKSLHPTNYCYTKDEKKACDKLKSMKTIPLKDIVDIIRPHAFLDNQSSNASIKLHNIDENLGEDLSDVGYFYPTYGDSIDLDYVDTDKVLKTNDIIFRYRGKPGKTLIVSDKIEKDFNSENEYIVPTDTSLILRKKDKSTFSYDQRVLYMYLISDLCQKYISTKKVFNSNPQRISIDELKNLPVPIFTKEECDRYLYSFNKIEQLKQEFIRVKNEIIDRCKNPEKTIDKN